MAIIKQYHKDTDTTYVYESESYWDKEKQQPRSRRKLIGKIDPVTGEVVPTGRKGRQKNPDSEMNYKTLYEQLKKKESMKDETIRQLKEQVAILTAEKRQLEKTLSKIRELIMIQ